jgi:hypothetical protein
MLPATDPVSSLQLGIKRTKAMTKTILVLAAALILFLPAAHADGTDGADALFEWTFSLTFVGDNACGTNGSGIGTSPCVETVNGSFEVGIFQNGLGFGFIDGTGSVTSTGPLSGFTCCDGELGSGDFVELLGPAEFDIKQFSGITGSEPPPGVYPGGGDIFVCPAGTCADDFFSGVPQTMNSDSGPQGFGTFTIREMPEPPMLAMMLLGVLPLAFIRRRA